MKISVSKLENALYNAGVNYIDLTAVTTVAGVRKAVTTKVLGS